MIRRYSPIAKSAGTTWPPAVRAEIGRLDGYHCVCARADFPLEVIARCGGSLELDHVRASGGIGMKSRSTVDNGVTLSAWCHRWKTDHGREARPLLLDWIARRESDCGETGLDEAAFRELLRGPMLAAYLEDLKAGRIDEDMAVSAIAGDYRAALAGMERRT